MNNTYQFIDILVNNKPLKQYTHNGRVYVIAQEDAEYEIRLANNSLNRVEAVVSVDQIDVISGEPASEEGRGYIIPGYSSTYVKGFRNSTEAVNAFKFSKKSKSYAAKSSEPGTSEANCGVIGACFFVEKVCSNISVSNNWNESWNTAKKSLQSDQFPNYNIYYSCSITSDLPPAQDSSCLRSVVKPAAFDMGTEFSKKEIQDKVSYINFERDYQIGVLSIFYASRSALEEMGVKLDRETNLAFPEPFTRKFCKAPK